MRKEREGGGAGEPVQWLRAQSALAENLGFVPSTLTCHLTTSVTRVPGDQMLLLASVGTALTSVRAHTCAHTPTHPIIIIIIIIFHMVVLRNSFFSCCFFWQGKKENIGKALLPWDVHKGICLILGKILKARKTGTTNLKKTHLLYPVIKNTRTQLGMEELCAP